MIQKITKGFISFFKLEAASGIVLLFAAVIALIISNSEISNLYLNKNIKDLSNLSNKELNETLLSVFGIGPWSVNMFEIFSIGKLDVFSSKDAGLRLAMNNASMVKHESDWKKYDEYAGKWSPYKTIASLHLWKTVD